MADLKGVIETLETVFDRFNERYFENALSKPVITVSPDTTRGAYGWCTTWKAWKEGESDGYYEINLCAEHLARPYLETCGTLLHEMVHLYNLMQDVQDCSRGGTYHNRKFKEAALAHGLECSQTEKYGWSTTKLTDDTAAFVVSLGVSSFSMYRSKPTKASKKSNTRKYTCPCCGMSVRATKDVMVKCAVCDVLMEKEG